MKNLNISFHKFKILESVSLNTAYIGAKNSEDSAFFLKVATSDDDTLLLSKAWTDMTGEIVDKVKEFTSNAELNDDLFSLSLCLSGSYDDSLSPSVLNDLENALSAGITARWFDFSYPERAKEWYNRAEILLSRVVSKLCHRRRPLRSTKN